MTDKVIAKNSLNNLMKFNKETRQLTRESLETALLNLLNQKSIAQISISELVSKAGVSRNAFYRNFSSKEEILESYLSGVLRRIFKGIKSFDLNTQASQAWLYLFTEAKKEETLFKAIFKQHMQQLLTQMVTKRLKAYQRWKKAKQSPYSRLFWSNAIVSVLSTWIKDGMKTPAEEMAKMGLPLLP